MMALAFDPSHVRSWIKMSGLTAASGRRIVCEIMRAQPKIMYDM